jgi:DNA polymerase elongation subunit (family B)
MRILTLDIETTYMQLRGWRLHGEQHYGLNQIADPGGVICWAAKWADSDKVMSSSVWQHGEQGMAQRIHKLLDAADVVVGYNHCSFDLKHLNALFVAQGMPPPSPYRTQDLLRVVRRRFKFPSSKLDYVAGVLLGERKLQHAGFDLWVAVAEGDPAAQRLMLRYCKQDVVLTEKLATALEAWTSGTDIAGHGMFDDDGVDKCPRCGSVDLHRRGWLTSAAGRYRRYQCQQCGGWTRGTTIERRTNVRAVA